MKFHYAIAIKELELQVAELGDHFATDSHEMWLHIDCEKIEKANKLISSINEAIEKENEA